MTLLDKIKEAMADRNMNEMARRIGIHANTLRAIRRGEQMPSYETLMKLAEYLKVQQ